MRTERWFLKLSLRRSSGNFLGVKNWDPSKLPVTMQHGAPQKDHKSALCLIPPRHLWSQVQEVRCFRDKGFCRWPPHVNLVYPFIPDVGNGLEKAAQIISEALKPFARFPVHMSTLKYFVHGSNSATVWLDPESDQLNKLQSALARAFPEYQDLNHDPSRGIVGFVPHLSLGQWTGKVEAERAIQEISSAWKPGSFDAWEVVIMSRRGFDDPFVVRYSIPIGQGSYKEVNVPYAATVGNGMQKVEEDSPARFGIGALSEGVWNFAYGANVNQEKLLVGRRITPYESVPAVLPGYRLAFNHRGAMGNVMHLSEPIPQNGWTSDAHGVLHRLKVSDYVKLTNMENAYRPVELVVHPYDKREPVRAVVYITPTQWRTVDGLDPPDRYINLIASGARSWDLEPSYVEWLSSLKTVTPKERNTPYWHFPSGERIPLPPVIRTGAKDHRQDQNRRRGRGRGGYKKAR